MKNPGGDPRIRPTLGFSPRADEEPGTAARAGLLTYRGWSRAAQARGGGRRVQAPSGLCLVDAALRRPGLLRCAGSGRFDGQKRRLKGTSREPLELEIARKKHDPNGPSSRRTVCKVRRRRDQFVSGEPETLRTG
jgi:hypothetical protein